MEGGGEVTTGRTNKTDGRRKPEDIGKKENVRQCVSQTKRLLLEFSTSFLKKFRRELKWAQRIEALTSRPVAIARAHSRAMSVINPRLTLPWCRKEPIHLTQQIMLCDTENKQTIK